MKHKTVINKTVIHLCDYDLLNTYVNDNLNICSCTMNGCQVLTVSSRSDKINR